MTNLNKWIFGVSDFSSTEPLQNAEKIIASGFDFIEPGLGKAAEMPEDAFQLAAERIKNAGIRVQSMNWFLPPTLKVTGPEVSDDKSHDFLSLALNRAEQLGAKAIVFGSPGSRSVPEGFSESRAREQMIHFCRLCSDLIKEHSWGMKIAVEHVNHTETNFLNTFAQALDLVEEVNRKEIGLAADFYHFVIENEATDVMKQAGELICAVQLANPKGRCFPRAEDEIPGMGLFFEHLTEIGYEGGISVEATVGKDLTEECREAVEYFSHYKI